MLVSLNETEPAIPTEGKLVNKIAEPSSDYFGGQWTIDKLDILEKYLDAYTTALKNQPTAYRPFKLVYIDAFAGTGEISLRQDDGDARAFIEGSARRAVKIDDKLFDRLIFVEKDPQRYAKLQSLREENPQRDIRTENSDANSYLRNLRADWNSWRGVLFLDPFATEVEWATIERIASFNALDTWILFPVSAIARMLPKSRIPDDISDEWSGRLTRIFGDESWRELYSVSLQGSLWGDVQLQRDPGVDGIIKLYKAKLESVFGDRLMERSKTLMNSTNSPLFEFMFCVGSNNVRAIGLAKRIAGHILNAST